MDLNYLKGYFVADGSVTRYVTSKGDVHYQTFSADLKDIELCKKFNELYFAIVKERERKVRTGAICRIFNVKFPNEVRDKVLVGMEGYKDYRTYFSRLNSDEKDSFIAGLFDGDGSVARYSNSKKVRVLLYSSQKEVSDIIESYYEELGISYRKYKDVRGHGVVQYHVGETGQVVKLWEHFGIKLELSRKREIFKLGAGEAEVLFYKGESFVTRKEMKRKLKLSDSSIHYRISIGEIKSVKYAEL